MNMDKGEGCEWKICVWKDLWISKEVEYGWKMSVERFMSVKEEDVVNKRYECGQIVRRFILKVKKKIMS